MNRSMYYFIYLLLRILEEKQFVCPECNKRYSKKDDLKNHLSVHNTTAVYKCKSCDKSFRVLTNLKRHMQTHTSK